MATSDSAEKTTTSSLSTALSSSSNTRASFTSLLANPSTADNVSSSTSLIQADTSMEGGDMKLDTNEITMATGDLSVTTVPVVGGGDPGSSASADVLFAPSVEMIVKDIGEEQPLEVDEGRRATAEALGQIAGDSQQSEQEMPVDELLALNKCNIAEKKELLDKHIDHIDKLLAVEADALNKTNTETSLTPNPPGKDVPIRELDIPVVGNTRKRSRSTAIVAPVEDDIEDGSSAAKLPAILVTSHPDDEDEDEELDEDAQQDGDEEDEEEDEEDDDEDDDEEEDEEDPRLEPVRKVKPVAVATLLNRRSAASTVSSSQDEDDEEEEDDDDESDYEEERSSTNTKGEGSSQLHKLYSEKFPGADQRLLPRSHGHCGDENDEEDDGEYSPAEDDFKKTIMVGSEFQAVIPEGLCKYGDALPYENEDKLVWDPFKLPEADVELYEHKSIQLKSQMLAAAAAGQSGIPSTSSVAASPSKSPAHQSIVSLLAQLPVGNHLRDDEHSLYLLLQCGHNVDEALRRRRIGQPSNGPAGGEPAMSNWSEEECRNFESGLRIYGKDFHTIQLQKVRTRAVGELVQFYYVWKKTQRHDVFANKARLDKKKYTLHPGLTDYMDRFLEEQECNGGSTSSGSAMAGGGSANGGGSSPNKSVGPHLEVGIRERSVSPSMNSLMYNNYRRYRMAESR